MTNKEELELIAKAKEGNQESFAQLFAEYSVLIKKIVRKFFLVGAELEDLQQEGTIAFMNAINSYSPQKEASFKTYSSLCIKRGVISAIKKMNSKSNKLLSDSLAIDGNGAMLVERNLEEDDDFIIVIPSDKMLPDDKLIWKEKLKDIKEFIAKNLSTYEKLVLGEYLKGESYGEIARIVNRDTTSVENALSRIRSKLNPLKGM